MKIAVATMAMMIVFFIRAYLLRAYLLVDFAKKKVKGSAKVWKEKASEG